MEVLRFRREPVRTGAYMHMVRQAMAFAVKKCSLWGRTCDGGACNSPSRFQLCGRIHLQTSCMIHVHAACYYFAWCCTRRTCITQTGCIERNYLLESGIIQIVKYDQALTGLLCQNSETMPTPTAPAACLRVPKAATCPAHAAVLPWNSVASWARAQAGHPPRRAELRPKGDAFDSIPQGYQRDTGLGPGPPYVVASGSRCLL